jgi:hypothetical protein
VEQSACTKPFLTASAPSQTQEGFRWTFIKYEGAKGFLPSLSAGEASGREAA